MNKRICFVIEAFILMIFFPLVVNANIVCNDGTISPSCADCHRGCCSHHGGCSNSSSSSSSSNSSSNSNSNNSNSSASETYKETPVIVENPKSKDATLKSVKIDYEEIKVSANMSYTTNKESVRVVATPNDNKATIDYDQNPDLVIGENVITIKVTAENGNIKEYVLNITREKILSNNKNIKIKVDDEDITFNAYKSDTIYLSYNKDRIDIKYELEDENAKAEIIGNENLKEGKNEVIVKVTAENGEEQNYTIVVEKYNKTDETAVNVIASLFVIAIFGGAILLIVKLAKKK